MNRTTPATTLADRLERRAALEASGAYPLTTYQTDPERYFRERLHVAFLFPHQLEILDGVSRGIAGEPGFPPQLSWRSAQKCAKSFTDTGIALWFYESFADARVFLVAANEDQLNNVLWTELRARIRAAKNAGADIEGKLAASPRGGLVSPDGSRQIRGITALQVEAIAGLSGRQLWIVDEASALSQAKAEAITGNRMGGGFLMMTGNPTRPDGPFFDSHNRTRDKWQAHHTNGEDLARYQDEHPEARVPHVINSEGIRNAAELFGGVEAPFYVVRVKGDFLRNETGRAIQFHQIEEAVARWSSMPDDGALSIGYDVAGPGDGGDLHAWAMVRGQKCMAIFTLRGLSEGAAVDMTLQLLANHRRGSETPHINIDAEVIGYPIFRRLQAEAEHRALHDRAHAFTVSGVKSSSKFVRDPRLFRIVREELVWTLAKWIANGGGIPKDDFLQTELHEPQWFQHVAGGQLYSTSKDEIRQKLSRSPDRMDSLALAVFRADSFAERDDGHDVPSPEPRGVYADNEELTGRGSAMDPHAGALDPYSGGFDPYGR
jgi:hypothetical protein